MQKILIGGFSLVYFGIFSQLALAAAPANCVARDQRRRDQPLSRTLCQSRFNYCAAYNRSLGLNWSGQPLPARQGGHNNSTGIPAGGGALMSANPGAATATPHAAFSPTNGGTVTNSGTISTANNGSAVTNSGVNSGRNGVAGGGNGLLSIPGMPRLKAQ